MSDFERAMGELHGGVFWPEFTFAENQFAPSPGTTGELADNLIWYGNRAFIVQMKARECPTSDAATEENWFRKKVLGAATKQIRDSLRYLEEHERIEVRNWLGHKWSIGKADLDHLTSLVIYEAAKALPPICRRTRHHVSGTAGFIHVIHVHDYLEILKMFSTPEDFRQYLEHRELILMRDAKLEEGIDEKDIIGAYILGVAEPDPRSREVLRRIPLEMPLLEFHRMLTNLSDHIQHTADPYSYYKILQHFANVPRSVWREVSVRFEAALAFAEKGHFIRPSRVVDPARNITFMIAASDPTVPRGGLTEEVRTTGLTNLSYVAMYIARTSKCIGILVSSNEEWRNVDWCFFDAPWEPDPDVEALIAAGSPFEEVQGTIRSSYLILPE